MCLGLVFVKIGMTRIFLENGKSLSTTVLYTPPNRIVQIKNILIDGYSSLQIAFGIKNILKVNKPLFGHYAKYGVKIGFILKEFIINESFLKKNNIKIGDNIGINIFNIGDFIDVRGISIGKGFAGTIKRYHFSSGRATHGNSLAHNVPGSIGMCQDPGKVFRGKKMSGHLGNKYVTIQNLKILRINKKYNLLFVSGAVPGNKKSILTVLPSVKFMIKKNKG